MLIVIAVIVILTALVVPAATSLGRANGLTTGGNSVTNLVSYARQLAVSKNTMTALVILANQGSQDDFRAITVLEYDPVVGWSQATEWRKLPSGIIFDPDPQESSFLNNSPRFPFLATTNQQNPPVSYPLGPGSSAQPIRDPGGYAARIFLPSGGLQNSEAPAQLRLVEGFMENGRVTRTRRGNTGSANFYDIAIIGATGIAKINRS
jgi:hypothetical protein